MSKQIQPLNPTWWEEQEFLGLSVDKETEQNLSQSDTQQKRLKRRHESKEKTLQRKSDRNLGRRRW